MGDVWWDEMGSVCLMIGLDSGLAFCSLVFCVNAWVRRFQRVGIF